MKLSIIIPSYKRAKLLDIGLWSLSQQSIKYPYEIIILNDGINDGTKDICRKYKNKLNIRYVFTGQRNLDGIMKWRIPGIAINEGVRRAKGNIILLSNPEILIMDDCINDIIGIFKKHKKALIITDGKNDDRGLILKSFNYDIESISKKYNGLKGELNTKLPFFMAMTKQEFKNINGYDEDFTGYCFDDDDFVERLLNNGCYYVSISARIIHLYHGRKKREGLLNKSAAWKFNKRRLEKKRELYTSENLLKKKEMKLTNEEIKEEQYSPSEKWELTSIPKIAHFYWGEEKLPYIRYLTVSSFIKYNPDWEIRFYYPKYRKTGIKSKSWSSHEHKYDINISKDYYPLLKKLPLKLYEIDFDLINISNDLPEVHKSDYLRWYLLSVNGGLWSDMDIIYFDSMNNISLNTEDNKNINTVICYHEPWKHSIGFLLSSVNNEYYKNVWEEAKIRMYDSNSYQTMGSLLINSTMKSPENIEKIFSNIKLGNITMDTVYPYNSSSIRIMFMSKNTKYISKNTIGLHWYAGHPKAGDFVSILNKHNYQTLNNVISEIIDISKNKNKFEIIKYNDAFNFNKKPEYKKLTIHAVVKNEPFIYYSIKSIYDYADKILLYDTGSNDKYTLKDIETLLKEDTEHKIIFKQIPLDFDETQWTYEHVNDFAKKHQGKMSVGKVRQIQIDDTDTEFCMIVDGDEIHYRATMDKIKNNILPYLSQNIIGVNVPLIWFYDINHTFDVGGLSNTGRIWRTNEVVMNGKSPNEAHCFKNTGIEINITDKEYLICKDLIPFAHFETFLKPWRRIVKPHQISLFKGNLPEVILENPYYMNRYLKEMK